MTKLAQSWIFSGKINAYKLVKASKGLELKIGDFSKLVLEDPEGEENPDISTFLKDEITGSLQVSLDKKKTSAKLVFDNIDDAWRFKMRYGDFLSPVV
jgi:hypothetical protein